MADKPEAQRPPAAKKPRGKRTKEQVLHDTAEISRLYRLGVLQTEIARQLELTNAMVSRTIDKLNQEWLKAAGVDFYAARARELADINYIEMEASEAWEASKKDERWTTKSGGEGLVARATITSKSQTGDPQYLKIMLDCVDKRCKLLGLVVQKVEHTGKDGGPIETKIDAFDKLFQMMGQLDKTNGRSASENLQSD